MTTDHLAPYAIDQPLTEEELQLIETLRTCEGGESHLEALEAAGVQLEASGTDGTRIVSWDADVEVIEKLLQQSLFPLSASLYQQGQPGLAMGAAGLALRVGQTALVPDHPDTLASRNTLAVCLGSLGRSAEALPLHERTLADQERVLGPDHPETLNSRSNLAECLGSLGRSAEALPLNERTLADREQVLGPDHPNTMTSRSNLASHLKYLGRAGEALPLHERTLADRERVLGPDHPDTLISRNNLALCLGSLGRSAEALPLNERTLADRERVLGPDHPETLSSRNNLASRLESLGRAGEALPLHEHTLSDRERVQGPDHPDTLASRNNLAMCLTSLGRAGEGLPLYERTLANCERELGPDHPDTLASRNNLASCLGSLGRSTEGLPLHERTLSDRERELGPEHPDTLASCNNLAVCLDNLGRADEALIQWQTLAQSLQLRPQPGGQWLDLLGYCVTRLARYAQDGQLPDWESQFSALSASLLNVIDLESPEQMEAARAGVTGFYTTYLGLCVDLDRRDLISSVLAARQGRKLAALLLDELEAAGDSLDPDSPRGRLQVLRLELRQLSLGLKVVEGSGGSFGGEDQRVTDADAFFTRQREQMDAYKDKLDQYRQLKAELEQTDADFAVSAAALNPTLPQLQAGLGEGEGLALLFEVTGNETEPATQLALLITCTESVLVPLLGIQLQQSTELVGSWRGQLHSRAGMRRAGSWDSDVMVAEPPADEGIYSDLASALRAGLWTPLAEQLDGLTRLHLVTHGHWHLLPVELGAPPTLELTHYPGFIYYHRLRHQGAVPGMAKGPETGSPSDLAPDETTPLGLTVHAAEDTPGLEAIPFVRAEADLISALWPGPVQADPDLDAEQPVLGALHLAAHGQADDKDPARANVVLGNRVLDFHAALGARQHPPVVVLSACTVGRTSDDPDGEPLGLVGSFLLKGTRYVIASLQPVPDFYMPLLMALFHQAWQITESPDKALAEARRRLKAGDWYPETEVLVHTHYQPIIEQALTTVIDKPKRPGWQDSLLQLTHAWPFPKPYRALHPDDDQHSLDELRDDIASDRSQLAAQILDTLIAERAQLPGAAIDTLSTWVRGFGTMEPPVASAEEAQIVNEKSTAVKPAEQPVQTTQPTTRSQNMVMVMVTTETATLQSLRELFEAAFFDCEIDQDGELAVEGKYRYYIQLDEARRFVRFYFQVRPGDDASAEVCSQYCETVNREMIVMRLSPVNDNQVICMDWYLSLAGDVTPKHLVQCFKEYDALVQDALQRGMGSVF